MTPQLSVVVPCFNEAAGIERFHSAVEDVLGPTGIEFEICYVDDGSTDPTRDVIDGLGSADRRVRYSVLSRNFGKEAAILAGLRMSRGRAVVIMDADLQHPPELIPRMLELHRKGYDQVIPRRDREGEGLARTVLSRGYYTLVRHLMDVEVIDGAGDFRLLSRQAVDTVLSLPETNRFSKGIFSWIGFTTATFTYRNAQRLAGTSKWGSRRLLNYGIDGLLSFNNRPLRLAIYAGFWCLLAAVVYAAWVGFNVALHEATVPGYATLLMVVVGVGGIQLITLGIIGEYVGRIYHEVKRRPPFVVRETDEHSAPKPFIPHHDSDAGSAGPATTARQSATFVAIGFVNTAVYLSIYAVLNPWIPYLTAHVLGYTVSIIGFFLLNSYITCRTRPTWRAFLRYPLSSGFNLVASGALLYVAVSRLGMDKNVAALIAGVLVTPVSFLLARWAINSGRRPENIADTNQSNPVETEQNDPTLG
ncbi:MULTISPECIES: glycosyltransferase [Streptomyces]|uniref:glycosyltransferase n=1 Tax=Streptomyces TaxID=1883 RepID=UPI00081B0F11|nr:MULTISPECIES: glycosyltransferase [unclassified Streptomyces]MYQ52495.1 glycosyltransferase [Streptomyces sp. SID4941]SCD83646.1 Glycosyltransferase involved in cell wall bisynthesis [Streptomyces sp. PalvLS-984]SDD26960.1 Glycosyltransferase involved in cell wall bisynthesis [Streptomyces sp. AmelKG-A3]